MGTIVVEILVLLVIGNAVRCIIKDKKTGKSCASCGGCGGCAGCKTKE